MPHSFDILVVTASSDNVKAAINKDSKIHCERYSQSWIKFCRKISRFFCRFSDTADFSVKEDVTELILFCNFQFCSFHSKHIRDFLISPRSFANSWGGSQIHSLVIIIQFRFTCRDGKLCQHVINSPKICSYKQNFKYCVLMMLEDSH